MEAKSRIPIAAMSFMVSAALVCAACSGGTEGPSVSGPGPGPDEPPQPGYTLGGDGTSTGPGGCTTCAGLLAGDIPDQAEDLCPGVEGLFTEVISCLCVGECSEDCGSFCTDFRLDGPCSSCGGQSCSAQLSACQSG